MLENSSKPSSKKDILAFVNELEEKFPVYEWKYEGIDLWPFIRQLIFQHFLKKKITTKKKRKAISIKNLFRSYRAYSKFFRSLTQIEFLFSAYEAHRNRIHNISFNRFADPVMDQLLELSYTSLLLEQSKTDKVTSSVYKRERFQALDNALEWINIKFKIRKKLIKQKPIILIGFDDFLSHISKVDIALIKKINRTRVGNIALRVRENKLFAKMLLKRTKPKAVLLVCYYGEWQQALIVAAKEKNIPTYDIQHGIIYEEHYSYGKFSGFPATGLSTLPDFFCTWSKYEANILNSWLPNSSHKAIPLGNPWLMAFQENKVPKIQNLSEIIELNKKLILYTLGNRGEQFPPYLVSLIRENSSEYEFWFRLHPRQLFELEKIKQELSELGIINLVNIEEGTFQPLPNILNHTDLHITLMSSVAIEAANMGVPSIILHKEGREYYEDHEIRTYCTFFEEGDDLGDQVRTVLSLKLQSRSYEVGLKELTRKIVSTTSENY